MSNFTVTQEDMDELYDMMATCRPHDSATEKVFVQEFLEPLGIQRDDFGNAFVQIGTAPVIWSSHVDTVHHRGGTQHIVRDAKFNLKLASSSASNCLGADDTAGVWLMAQMIKAKRPGVYVFHRGEEKGGLGSAWLTKTIPKFTEGVQAVIALDRRGDDSVITFQGGQRCCSDDFGNSLAAALNAGAEGFKFKLDQGGSFTDSANYTDLVGECTNLSVGYSMQHCKSESVSLTHLIAMRESLLQLDVDKLVFKRKPGEKEARTYATYRSSYYDREYDPDEYYGCYGNGQRTRIWSDSYYEQEFRGGYWEDNKWKSCTVAEWAEWVAARKKKEVKSTVKHENVSNVDMNLLIAVRTNTIPLTRMLQDWGFDRNSLLYILEDFGPESEKKEVKTTLNGTNGSEHKAT